MTQTEAFTEMNDFKRLIETSCSGAILSFLCGYYAPVCLQNQLVSTITLLPCRSLCMEVRSKCEYFVQCGDHGNPSWPAHLDCQNFPDEMPCFGPDDPSTITIPSDVPGITVTSINSSSFIELRLCRAGTNHYSTNVFNGAANEYTSWQHNDTIYETDISC